MSDLAASTVRINDIETAQQAPNSEALQQKMGGAINGLLDRIDALEALNLLTSTPVKFETGSVSTVGGGTFTTSNLKQIYFAVLIAQSRESSDVPQREVVGFVWQGKSFTFETDNGGISTWVASISGTNNRSVTIPNQGGGVSGIVYIFAAIEP